jgi:putative transcriptional regulator
MNIVTGKILIAEPFLKDPNFKRSVVLICEHSSEGSIGFVINNEFKHTLSEIVPELPGANWPLYLGGPVETDSLHFLHRIPSLKEESKEIAEGVYWSQDFNAIIPMIKSGEIDGKDIRFYLGYSGWSEGQLEMELDEKTWIVTDGDAAMVFTETPDKTWKNVLKQMGGDFSILANSPMDPQLN